MNKSNFSKSILIIVLIGIILTSAINTNSSKTNSQNQSSTESYDDLILKSAQDFEFIQDFEASTYFISPYTSEGENDKVFFSFMGNKKGNYTMTIENCPAFITDSQTTEYYPSFDNPSGTDLWFIGYNEFSDTLNDFGTFYFKYLVSEDKGKTWRSNLIYNTTAGSDLFMMSFYALGSAIAVNPETGFMIYLTWLNRSDLTCFRSFDNGTTWSEPITIFNSTVMGAKYFFDNPIIAPRFDVAIMKNGSVLVVSDCYHENYTDLVYFQSDNNGTDGSWSIPRNVTCSADIDAMESTARNPKIQISRTSGDYWLMWRDQISGVGTYKNDTNRWAQFQPNQDLSANVQVKNVSTSDIRGSYDFYLDHANNKFRMISLSSPDGVEIINWSTSAFNTDWTKTILGEFTGLGNIDSFPEYLNYIYSDGTNNLYYRKGYFENNEIYQYKVLPESIFLIKKGYFDAEQLVQFSWNGYKYDGSPIETSLVKVLFMDNYTEEEGIKTFFIIIDNQNPLIKEFLQKRQYFNPLSSNITLTEIPWEIRPSESCYAYLNVYSEESVSSSWQQILENNWDDSEPQIFYSYRGILYVAYKSFESGRHIIYIIKSYDMGITWSEPLKIYESTTKIPDGGVKGAAWADVVCVYIHGGNQKRLLYRSFDQASSFQDPLNLSDTNLFDTQAKVVSDIVFSNNGRMFMTYRNDTTQFYVICSSDLGLNWSISKIFLGNNSWDVQSSEPLLEYDSMNNLIHFAMVLDQSTGLSKILNISVARLNVTNNKWSTLESFDLYYGSFLTRKFDFIITRDNKTAIPKIRITFLKNVIFPDLIFEIQEIVSEDLGDNWSSPKDVDIDLFNTVCTNLDEIFYIRPESDGNDEELFFKREGKLIRTDSITLSSSSSKEISFDGIDDFEEYIEEGNYTYTITLKDYAGNTNELIGWFFTDYNAPQITDLSSTLGYPLPRYDFTITANITDSINFTAYLHYKKDDGTWQKIQMENVSTDYFSATIPGDSLTNRIQYYIKSTDLAGNEEILDNNGEYFSYGMPSFSWDSEGLFKESKSYSSSQDYEITIIIESNLEYVDEVIFRYSYDEGGKWEDLELKQSSPEFSGELDDVPGDLRVLHYKVIVIDIYGNEYELTDTREINFYPEVPSVEFEQGDIAFIMIISAIIGIVVGIGYIKLKSTSHETMYKQIFLKDYAKKIDKAKEASDDNLSKSPLKRIKNEPIETRLESLPEIDTSTPFTKVYLGILCATISVFSIALLFSVFAPTAGMLILSASLLMGVFGYMILMSRDISINIYLERIYLKNIALEVFQIFFMFINIVAILLVGYTIDWFRYYLIESTYNIGSTSIPRLYFSIFAVFFTSLVLVGITTYIQLKKTVKNLQLQSSQGASPNLLLYLKDQNASRLITRLGYKTVIFLVTVLLAVITTTNLLTEETGIALLLIVIPFAIASFLTMMVHRFLEMKSEERKKEDIQLPFSDSKKFCSKCGEPLYLSNKFCGSCGFQQIYEDIFGTYVSRCTVCNALVNEKARFCTECGKKIQTSTKIKD